MRMIEPVKELGMHDFQLDEIDDTQRHPGAVARLLGRRSQPTINQSGGELLGRKLDGGR
jgi:hypothetical protein